MKPIDIEHYNYEPITERLRILSELHADKKINDLIVIYITNDGRFHIQNTSDEIYRTLGMIDHAKQLIIESMDREKADFDNAS